MGSEMCIRDRAGACCVSGSVKAREPPRPSSNDAAALAVDCQSTKRVTHCWCKRNRLAMHVNAGSFSNRPEQRSPPRCRLTELAGIENGLNRCQNGFSHFKRGFSGRLNVGARAFMKLRSVIE